MQRCLQAHSRLTGLLVNCKLYDAGVAALNQLLAVLPPGDSADRTDANKRIEAAQEGIDEKRAANHYKLLGLASRNCPLEVSPLADSDLFVFLLLCLKKHWSHC